MYYLSRSPCPTTFHPWAISPRSRPTGSGSARASFRLRFRSGGFQTFSVFGESAGRQGKEKIEKESWPTGKQSPLDRKLLNRSNSRNFNFGHLSLSFGSLQSLRSFARSTWERQGKVSLASLPPLFSFTSLCRKTPFIKLRLGKLVNKESGRKKMPVPKFIVTLGEYLKNFGLIFLSQLIWISCSER